MEGVPSFLQKGKVGLSISVASFLIAIAIFVYSSRWLVTVYRTDGVSNVWFFVSLALCVFFLIESFNTGKKIVGFLFNSKKKEVGGRNEY